MFIAGVVVGVYGNMIKSLYFNLKNFPIILFCKLYKINVGV